MMRKNLIIIALLAMGLGSFAQSTEWTFDHAHSKIRFVVAHMVISEVEGQFKSYNGLVKADKDDFSDALVEFTIESISIDTDNDRRNGHLKSADFFDVEKFPSITFKSTKIESVSDGKYKLHGDFTMHSVTKQITLDMKYGGTITDGRGRTHAGFKITGSLDRTEWGLTYNSVMDAGGLVVGEEIEIVCNIELIKS